MNVSDAVHATVMNYPGGAEALAPRVNMTPGVLRNKANPNSNSHRTAIEEASLIMGVSNDFQILHALAAEHGYFCVKAAADDSDSVLGVVLNAQAREGDLSRTLHDALADGAISKRELDEITAAAFAVQSAIGNLIARCKAAAIPAPPKVGT